MKWYSSWTFFVGIVASAMNWSSTATVASDSADSATSRCRDVAAGELADIAEPAPHGLARCALEASLDPLLDSGACLAPGDPPESEVAIGSEDCKLLSASLRSFAMLLA